MTLDRQQIERVLFRAAGRERSERGQAPEHHMPAEAVRLTGSVAPAAVAALREVSEHFGIEREVLLYQVPDARSNALCNRQGESVVVLLIGRILARNDAAAFRAVIGHELGHHLVNEARFVASPLEIELTADRFGVIASGDPAASVSLELTESTGLLPGALGMTIEAFLEEARDRVEVLRARHQTLPPSRHPEPLVRAWAAWAFGRTDLFRELTGRGPADLSIAAVDEQLSALCP